MNQANGPWSGCIPVPLTSRATSARRRTDAERNRVRVLAAVRRLVAERGMAAVTMDDVAEAAGVGKGTVYRGFGSRSGLAEALLDDAERQLQERMLTGRAPLGPGADPGARLTAFVSAYVAFLEVNVELLLETERVGQGARFHTGAYVFWRLHVASLLGELGHGNASLLADVLLATMSADLYRHLRSGLGLQAETLCKTLTHLSSLLATRADAAHDGPADG